ncbi:MAG: peptidylprolyl isomerase [Ignavibacteriaceae bacterium]|nr:peptidylprolyl isomerase [Ignavibacteriaceae bacterium]
MSIKPFYFIVLSLILVGVNFPQSSNKKVASFANQIISEKEFRQRFELTPRLGDTSFDIDSLKKEFLASLLAEKLWAKEAEELGFDTLEVIKYALKPIEKYLIKDALYKSVVLDKIKLKNEELIRANARKSITLKVNIINSRDSVEIFSIFSQLKKGESFDSILALRTEAENQSIPIEIKFGQLVEQFVEDTLYNLKPGNFTTPLQTENGWFIFKMIDKIRSTADDKTKVEEILKERKAKEIGTKFLREFFKGVTIHTDRELFNLLFDEVKISLRNKKATNNIKHSGDICLDESDISSYIEKFGKNRLDLSFVKLNEKPISFREFIYTLAFDGLCIRETSDEAIFYRLDQNVRKFIQTELLVREGIKKGLNNSPDVLSNMDMWKTNYTSQLLRNRYVDSVQISEEEYDAEISKKSGHRVLINIALLETNNLDVIDNSLTQIQDGKPFHLIASENSENSLIRNNNGFTGFVTPESLGEIGAISLTLEENQIYGPLKVKDGYALFQLINKFEEDDSTSRRAPINIEEIKQFYYQKKLENVFLKKTYELADKHGFSIDNKTLKEIKVSPIPMFTHRVIGFGGRIAAFPYTNPWYNWIDKYLQIKKDLP